MKTHAIAGTLALVLLLPIAGCNHSGQSDAQQAITEVDNQTSPAMISSEIH